MYDAYPHQLSGGQQQRVAIAQALACEPMAIIADEPTAALDADTEAEILQLFREFKAEGMSLILITHHPSILHKLADRVAVMYAGRVVEEGPAERIFAQARHPYVRALLACTLAEDSQRGAGQRLRTIAGAPPDHCGSATGCDFFPRCAERLAKCEQSRPDTQWSDDGSRVACFLYD
jgi:peptide/nickel transport system ATP-binding protein